MKFLRKDVEGLGFTFVHHGVDFHALLDLLLELVKRLLEGFRRLAILQCVQKAWDGLQHGSRERFIGLSTFHAFRDLDKAFEQLGLLENRLPFREDGIHRLGHVLTVQVAHKILRDRIQLHHQRILANERQDGAKALDCAGATAGVDGILHGGDGVLDVLRQTIDLP